MRKTCVLLIALVVMLCFASHAVALGFGSDENIHAIQDIEGTNYRLCHKTTLHFFGAGIYMTDDGYVLQERGMYDRYIPLEESDIHEMQNEGLLPNPLPQYSIPIQEYVFGYSLWIVIAFSLAWPGMGSVIRHLSDAHRIKGLLANPHYREALKIALNSDGNGINEAVDYLQANNVPLTQAQTDMQLLLSKGAALSR